MTQATAPLAAPATDNNLVMRRRIALTMLFLVGTINFVDRQLLSILVEPVRAELDFTDTQFGLLTGLAFALFYAAMGVPVAMLADRWNRVKLIGIACVVYSGFTMACGMVSNFWQLALMRFGVGAGEAGGTAPSLSVLADYYPPAERPFAIGLLTLNGPFGVFVGAAFGAWAAANIGWRGAFMVIGAIGMAFVPIMLWLVREPARGQMDKEKMADEAISFSQSLALFIRRRSLRLLLIGSALPAFLMRTQKMPLEAMATYYAPAAGITFGIGILGGGWLVSQRAKISPRAYGSIPALASLLLIPTFIMALMADSWQMSLALLLIPMAACTVYVPPALALVQNLTPPRSRATAAALLLLVFNIIGLGMGPVFTGVLSDMLKASFGDDSLRFALIGLVPFAAAAGIAQFSMTRHLDRDFAE
jgi:MFS family permease